MFIKLSYVENGTSHICVRPFNKKLTIRTFTQHRLSLSESIVRSLMAKICWCASFTTSVNSLLSNKSPADQIQRVIEIVAETTMMGQCLPIKWDKGSHRLYLNMRSSNFEAKVEQKKLRLFRLLGINRVAALVLFGQIFLASASPVVWGSSASKTLCLMTLIVYLVFHSYLHFCTRRCENIASVINGLLELT